MDEICDITVFNKNLMTLRNWEEGRKEGEASKAVWALKYYIYDQGSILWIGDTYLGGRREVWGIFWMNLNGYCMYNK